jgi:EAL domain-containing protein (putative c-di-GMP-specific phosphodiesterase class I)
VAALDTPLEIQGLSIRVSAGVGVARPTAQSSDLETFLRSADVALTQARHRGQSIVEFNPADDPAAEGNVGLMAELHRGLERNELIMYFQPLVRVRDRRVIGAEALVRWNHPTRGLLPPGAFIEAAEQGGLIGRVTQKVLAQSCDALSEWLTSGLALTMSVNISGIDLMDERLPETVAESLAAHGLPAERLVLEITETAIGSDPELSLRTVAALRDLGVGIAIDDFGVGYSSLSQLMDTPVDEIKLDGSFLRGHDGAKREAALRATQHLATAIGATMVAEGVETLADFELLERLGCELAQGYHFTKPLPAAEFLQLVQRS